MAILATLYVALLSSASALVITKEASALIPENQEKTEVQFAEVLKEDQSDETAMSPKAMNKYSQKGIEEILLPRSKPWAGKQKGWRKKADEAAEALQKLQNPSIILYGDSIVEDWNGNHGGLWEKYFTKRYGSSHASGISGDCVGNLLYRLQNGESPKRAQPRVIMLHIGTHDLERYQNYLGWFRTHTHAEPLPIANAAETMRQGVKNIVNFVLQESPHSQIVLTNVMPRSREWPNEPYGSMVTKVNARLASLADNSTVHFSDCSKVLLGSNGKVDPGYASDYLHPSDEGAKRWAKCLQPTLDQILKPTL